MTTIPTGPPTGQPATSGRQDQEQKLPQNGFGLFLIGEATKPHPLKNWFDMLKSQA